MNKRHKKSRIDSVTITYLPGHDVVVLKKSPDSQVFITTNDSVVIGRDTLITLLNYLVKNNIVSHKVIGGILEEYNTE